jgi:adenine deaminase
MDLARVVAAARGAESADLLLRGGRVVNVCTGEVYLADVAVCDGVVAGLGPGYEGREAVDLDGAYVCPGFIDAHVHVESALVPPREFARAVVPRGVTTAVTNPHEIANVLGVDGIRYMLEEGERAPLDLYVTLPSCVPATPLETSGARLEVSDLRPLMDHPKVLGLGEVMDFPGVVAGNERVLGELRAFAGRVVDGHCPGLSGRELNAYVAAGIGSDHECTSRAEALERLRLGMTVFFREASGAKNLRALLPLLAEGGPFSVCLCTDDRDPGDLLGEGSIDHLVRCAIEEGLDAVSAIRLATLNPAVHFRLHDRGAVAPGRRADLVTFADLSSPRPDRVYRAGQLVARQGRLLEEAADVCGAPSRTGNTVRVAWDRLSFAIPAGGQRIRVIGLLPDQLVTEALILKPSLAGGFAVADSKRDLLKMAVIERHRGTGRVGLGFVQGLGLARGAIAGTVAHDHHNLIVIGADDDSMTTAARAAAATGGGLAAADGDKVLARVPLPIAGLMSDQPIERVRDQTIQLLGSARELGTALRDPFMALSFLALEVIPALKLTDLGLVDVERLELVPLFLEE